MTDKFEFERKRQKISLKNRPEQGKHSKILMTYAYCFTKVTVFIFVWNIRGKEAAGEVEKKMLRERTTQGHADHV